MLTNLIIVAAVLLLIGGIIYLRRLFAPVEAAGRILTFASKMANGDANKSSRWWRKIKDVLWAVWSRLRVWLQRTVFLQPYGDSLLDAKSKLHLTLYGLFILAMAGIEGFSWGAVGYMFFPSGLGGLVAAGGLFVLIGGLVWGLDASLALHDSLAERHSRDFGVPYEKRGPGMKLAIPIRLALLAASLLVAAPLVAIVVFKDDVRAELRQEGIAAIAKKRTEIEAKHGAILQTHDRAIRDLQQRLELELAGKGNGNGGGFGIVAKHLQHQIDDETAARQNDLLAGKGELDAFNRDGAGWEQDPDTLASRWNVVVPRLSILKSTEVIKILEKRDDYHHVELSVQFVFVLAFAAVVICKLYESHSVGLYHSSILQGLYRQFPPVHPISAEAFYVEMLDERTRQRNGALLNLKCREPELIEAVNVRKAAARARSDVHEAAQSELERRTTQLKLQQRKSERCAEDVKQFNPDSVAPAFRHVVEHQLRNAHEEEDSKLAVLETELRALARSVEKAKAECDSINTELAHYADRLIELRQKIAALESELIDNDRSLAA